MSPLVSRHLSAFAADILDTFPVLMVQGARQVGKSTFTQMLSASRPSRILTFDDRVIADAARNDPQTFVSQLPLGTLVVDEVQRVPELTLAIKAAVDRDRTPGRFVLTGSSDLLRPERTPDSLAGRAVGLQLRGFSQGEIAGRKDDIVTALLGNSSLAGFTTSWTREAYVDVVGAGGYPEVRRLTGRLRTTWIDSYLSRVVQRDAAEILNLAQPDRLLALLRLIATNQSGELVKARLAEQARIPASTITSYLDALETLFLVGSLPPWTPNLTRREIGRPKSMVEDSALALRLAGVSSATLLSPSGYDHLGGFLEAFAVAELLKQQGWSETSYQIFHFRDRNGPEVDIVVQLDDGTVFGFEVKASSTFRSEHFAGLKVLADRLGDRFRGGLVLGTAQQGLQFGRNLWGLPISALWEL